MQVFLIIDPRIARQGMCPKATNSVRKKEPGCSMIVIVVKLQNWIVKLCLKEKWLIKRNQCVVTLCNY